MAIPKAQRELTAEEWLEAARARWWREWAATEAALAKGLVFSTRSRRWMTRAERDAETRAAALVWTGRYWQAQYGKWW